MKFISVGNLGHFLKRLRPLIDNKAPLVHGHGATDVKFTDGTDLQGKFGTDGKLKPEFLPEGSGSGGGSFSGSVVDNREIAKMVLGLIDTENERLGQPLMEVV